MKLLLWIYFVLNTYHCSKRSDNIIPVKNYDSLSAIFSVKAGNVNLSTAQYKDFHYASFQQDGKTNIIIKCSEEIRHFKISPLSKRIGGRLSDSHTIEFSLAQPSYLVITVNNKIRLFLLGENVVTIPRRNIVSIFAYSVDTLGNKLNTVSIQKAIKETALNKQILFFPPGIYRTGRLVIPSNTRIFLSAGAVLKASDNISDLQSDLQQKPKGFINLLNAQNVEIRGLGVVDGNGKFLREKYGNQARFRLIFLSGCKNVSISDITQRDPGSWNTQVRYSSEVIFKNVKILNDADLSNTDGFDPDASSFITIEDCFGYCGDDNVAIKITLKNDVKNMVSNIAVRGCVFLTRKSSLKVGTETRGKLFRNILFENNDVIQSDRGMALYCADGASFENIRYINNHFEENYADAKRSGVFFQISKRNPDSEIGVMKNILIKDCNFLVPFPNTSKVEGFDEAHSIELKVSNLVIGGEKCTSPEDARIDASFARIEMQE